jgi:hypothetical protein
LTVNYSFTAFIYLTFSFCTTFINSSLHFVLLSFTFSFSLYTLYYFQSSNPSLYTVHCFHSPPPLYTFVLRFFHSPQAASARFSSSLSMVPFWTNSSIFSADFAPMPSTLFLPALPRLLAFSSVISNSIPLIAFAALV